MAQLPEEARLLVWKLSEARTRAAECGFDAAALLIRLAIDEIQDANDAKPRTAEQTKSPPQ